MRRSCRRTLLSVRNSLRPAPASKDYLWGSLKFLVHPKDRVASEVHQINSFTDDTAHTLSCWSSYTGDPRPKGYGQRLLFCLLKCDPPTVRSFFFSHIWKKRNKDRPVTGITCRGGKWWEWSVTLLQQSYYLRSQRLTGGSHSCWWLTW